MAQDASRFYGTAGKIWVDHLTKHQTELPTLVAKIVEGFVQRCETDEPMKNCIARKIGVLKAAGVVAVEAGILPCTKADIQKSCRWAYGEIIKTAFGHELGMETILEHIKDQLEFEIFPTYNQTAIRNNADIKQLDGFVNETNDKLILTANGFERLCDGLLPSNYAASERMIAHIRSGLIDHGICGTDARGNHVQSVNIAGNGQRRCVIDLARFRAALGESSKQPTEDATQPADKPSRRWQRKGKTQKRGSVRSNKSPAKLRGKLTSRNAQSSRRKGK